MKEVCELGDRELVSEVKTLRSKEKEVLYRLLIHLGEVDERKLYRDEGYTSFLSYLTDGLGYSKGSAHRRIEAARFLRVRPELYQKLTSGELSFIALAELSKVADSQNVEEIIQKSTGKSKDEVAELVREEIAPVVKKRSKERIRVVKCEAPKEAPLCSGTIESDSGSTVEPAFEIAFQADKQYQEAKALAGGFSMKEVFQKVLQDYTKRKSPKERMKRHQKRKQKPSTSSKPNSRYIPSATKDRVYLRDNGQCTYTAPDGRRCSCKQNLEFDHIYPHALGGESTEDNLRLLCRAHNQLMAERVFGKEFMQSKRE